jgi:hypothetical protein
MYLQHLAGVWPFESSQAADTPVQQQQPLLAQKAPASLPHGTKQ